MERVNKVVRLDENPMENEEEVKVDDGGDENELSPMDKLPNEILLKILDYLDEKQLVKFRILSSRWNDICCLLVQDKTKNKWDSKLTVELNNRECSTVITRSFDDFLDCFAMTEAEKSSARRRPFPFSQFNITDLHLMDRNQMTRFISLFVHIKTLYFDIKGKDLKNFGNFWRLLLKFAPNIEHLEMDGDQWCDIELFEPNLNLNVNCDPLQKEKETQIKEETFLDKLKVFEFYAEDISKIEKGALKFLEHVPNIQEISHYDPFFVLGLWQKLNRAHLLKTLAIGCNAKSDLLPAQLMKNLRLDYLWAMCKIFSNPIKNEKSSINYICQALKSSQETLSKCCLWNLTMENVNFCFRDIKSLPNLRHLRIHIDRPSEERDILDRLSQICPNITNFDLGIVQGDFSQVAPILWTRFKGLKFLEFQLYTIRGGNSVLALDSTFSGYSPESIQKIQDKLDEGISLEEARAEEEQNPSILDLKGLSVLKLKFLMGKRTGEMEKVESQLHNSVFMKILPQHIRENPRSVLYHYN